MSEAATWLGYAVGSIGAVLTVAAIAWASLRATLWLLNGAFEKLRVHGIVTQFIWAWVRVPKPKRRNAMQQALSVISKWHGEYDALRDAALAARDYYEATWAHPGPCPGPHPPEGCHECYLEGVADEDVRAAEDELAKALRALSKLGVLPLAPPLLSDGAESDEEFGA